MYLSDDTWTTMQGGAPNEDNTACCTLRAFQDQRGASWDQTRIWNPGITPPEPQAPAGAPQHYDPLLAVLRADGGVV